MGVVVEAVEENPQAFVDQGVPGDGVIELLELLFVGQLAVQQQIRDLKKRALFGELFDGVAAIEQHALVAIDEGDVTLAATGGGVARVVGEIAQIAVERADIDQIRPMRAAAHRCFALLAGGVVGDGNGLVGHAYSSAWRLAPLCH